MSLPEKIAEKFRAPQLTRTRMILALVVAVMTDGTQLVLGLLGPLSWPVDEAIDVFTMLVTSWLLGFHWLLLPTFVVKSVPVVEDLPTWTACVGAVIALRKRTQGKAE
jgi:hypothetical protein